MNKIFPIPHEFVTLSGQIESALLKTVDLSCFDDLIIREELKKINPHFKYAHSADISFIQSKLDIEEFKIEAKNNRIRIFVATLNAAYYAIQVLKKFLILEQFECFYLHDYPDLKIRGLMLDISRDRIYNLDTLKKIVYDMSVLRINHLELYVEGFSFELEHFRDEINIYNNYITLKEIKELEKYCNDHFIDLVPNQNGFGHMAEFLKLDKYHKLAEAEDGIYLWGANREPATLDFRNPASFELVKKLYQDMIPHFKSQYFNMDFDEPMELGKGKNQAYVEEHGEANAYLEYFNKLRAVVEGYGKIPMLWGDVLIKHKEALKMIPKNVIFIDWGYDHKYDFESHSKLLQENHVQFMNAPGTCTWANIVGKDIDMIGSIDHATSAAKKYGALGVINTDWGDFGHLQALSSSYPGYIYAACNSWSTLDKNAIIYVLNEFYDPKLASIIIELMSYSNLDEYRGYGNTLFSAITNSSLAGRYQDKLAFFMEKMNTNYIRDEIYQKYLEFFNDKLERLKHLDATIDRDELINNVELLIILNKINHKLKLNSSVMEEINELDKFSIRQKELWPIHSKMNGYYLSNKKIQNLKQILESYQESMERK